MDRGRPVRWRSRSGAFWRVVFPLLAPMNATVGIFAFLQSWNDFMMPSLIIANPQLQTIPVVQALFQSRSAPTTTSRSRRT